VARASARAVAARWGRLGGALSARAERRWTDRAAPSVIRVRIAIAGDLRGGAPAVREIEPPVAELVEIEEADDVAPSAEEDARRAPRTEVDLFPERPEGLGHLEDDLGVIPVREGLQVRPGAVPQRLHRDRVAGRRRQAAQ